jgi:hypothetical protein
MNEIAKVYLEITWLTASGYKAWRRQLAVFRVIGLPQNIFDAVPL